MRRGQETNELITAPQGSITQWCLSTSLRLRIKRRPNRLRGVPSFRSLQASWYKTGLDWKGQASVRTTTNSCQDDFPPRSVDSDHWFTRTWVPLPSLHPFRLLGPSMNRPGRCSATSTCCTSTRRTSTPRQAAISIVCAKTQFGSTITETARASQHTNVSSSPFHPNSFPFDRGSKTDARFVLGSFLAAMEEAGEQAKQDLQAALHPVNVRAQHVEPLRRLAAKLDTTLNAIEGDLLNHLLSGLSVDEWTRFNHAHMLLSTEREMLTLAADSQLASVLAIHFDSSYAVHESDLICDPDKARELESKR
ncbi:hypothetical protein L1887_56802 [Cichorium endivia]|nr:hypothetical protein L1887_56802 [Cichorium endivia]